MGEYLNLRVILRVVSSEIESMPWVPHRIESFPGGAMCEPLQTRPGAANVFAAVIIVVVVVVVIVISQPRV